MPTHTHAHAHAHTHTHLSPGAEVHASGLEERCRPDGPTCCCHPDPEPLCRQEATDLPPAASEQPSCVWCVWRGDPEQRAGPEARQQRPAEGTAEGSAPRRDANKEAAGAKRSREEQRGGEAARRGGGAWRPGAGAARPGAGAAEPGRASWTDGDRRSRDGPFGAVPWMLRPRGQAAAPPLPRSSSGALASQRRGSELLSRTHLSGCTLLGHGTSVSDCPPEGSGL